MTGVPLAAGDVRPDEAPPPPSARLRHLAVAAVSFGLLALAFAPVALVPLVFVALVPWLVHARLAPPRGFTRGWLAGSLLFASSLMWWVTSLAGAPAAGLAGWGAIVVVLLLMLLPFAPLVRLVVVRRDVPLCVGVPLVLAGQDALRDTVMDGVAWHSPGYALADWTTLIQVADLCGVAPLSLAIYAANGVLAEAVLRLGFRTGPSARAVVVRLLVVTAVFGAMYTYGVLRIAELDGALVEGPGVVGVQGNVPQEEKLGASRVGRGEIHARHVRLMTEGTAALSDVALYVWPETSFLPVDERTSVADGDKRRPGLDAALNRTRSRAHTSVARQFAAAAAGRRSEYPPSWLLGVTMRNDGPGGVERSSNTAVLVRRRGRRLEAVDRYDKRELVPFGEYVPGPPAVHDLLVDVVRDAAGYVPSMTAGERGVKWRIESPAGVHSFAVTICFEVVFPRYFSEARAEGADFMVNISNDAWYAGSAELALAHAQTRFRAVENRFSIFRVSNTGISTLVDPIGREVAVVTRDGRREDVEGVLAARVPLGAPVPPAVRAQKRARAVLILLGLMAWPVSTFFKRRELGGLGGGLFT